MGISAGVAAAMVGAQLYTSKQQKKAVEKATAQRQAEADRLFQLQTSEIQKQETRLKEQQEANKEAQSETEKTQKRDQASERKRKKEKGTLGRASTLLTGPQGLVDGEEQQGRGRTLLGV